MDGDGRLRARGKSGQAPFSPGTSGARDGADELAIFTRSATTGKLTYTGLVVNGEDSVTGLESPLGVTVSPDGANVYVSGHTADAVVTFSRNATNGELLFADVIFDTDLGVDGLESAAFLQVSPDGQHLYVAGNVDDSIAVFERSGGFGELTFVQVLKDAADVPAGLDGATNVAITPDGTAVYVSSSSGDGVVEFSGRRSTAPTASRGSTPPSA
jgi:6-phosphogluconolactonase (cycloisomerase 2 family)